MPSSQGRVAAGLPTSAESSRALKWRNLESVIVVIEWSDGLQLGCGVPGGIESAPRAPDRPWDEPKRLGY